MKLILFFLLFLTLTVQIFARTEIGIGLVEINFDDKTVLEFYEKPIDAPPVERIEFFNDAAINSWSIKNLKEEQKWLKPESLWLDYQTFVFRCTAQEKGWYKVIVNNESGKTYWIRKQKITEFKTWEQFLKEMFGIERATAQKIRQTPSLKSREVKHRGKDCFQVKSLKGEWIEIFTAEYCDSEYTDRKTRVESGWIKWRSGNRLLINYFITS